MNNEITEGKKCKGGLNKSPMTKRPPPPKPQTPSHLKETVFFKEYIGSVFGIPKKYLGSSSSCHATKTQKRF